MPLFKSVFVTEAQKFYARRSEILSLVPLAFDLLREVLFRTRRTDNSNEIIAFYTVVKNAKVAKKTIVVSD
jgi:hypothetical protein